MKKILLIMAMAVLVCWLPGQALASFTLTDGALASVPLSAPGAGEGDTSATATYAAGVITLTSGNTITDPPYTHVQQVLDTGQVNLYPSLVAGGFGNLNNLISITSSTAASYNLVNAALQGNIYWDIALTDVLGTSVLINLGSGNTLNGSQPLYPIIVTGGPSTGGYTWLGGISISTFAGDSLSSLGLGSDTTLFGAYTVEQLTIDVGGYADDTPTSAALNSITLPGTEAPTVPLPSTALLLGCGLLGLVGLGLRKRTAFEL